MNRLLKIWSVTTALVLFGLLACKKNDALSTNLYKNLLAELDDIVFGGELLLTVEPLGGDSLLFSFEESSLAFPKDIISSYQLDESDWLATVVLQDGQKIEIPLLGKDLDFVVKGVDLNPSAVNPLAAKVEVLLPARGRIKAIVQGKHEDSQLLSYTFKDDAKRQHLPILGLYADYENKVDLVFLNLKGEERARTTLKIQTQPLSLSSTFPRLEVKKRDVEAMEPGFNLVNYPGESELDTSVPYIVDEYGEIRWILLLKNSPNLNQLSFSIGLKATDRGTYLAGDMNQDRVVEIDVFGNLIGEWDLKKHGFSFHHEIVESRNGHFLITVSKKSAVLVNGKPRINDFIIEYDPQADRVVSEWDLVQMLDSSRYQLPDGVTPEAFVQTPSNWAHNNSILEWGGDYVATMRYQGMFCFTPAGKVKWILSPHKNWGSRFDSSLLRPLDGAGVLIDNPQVLLGNTPHMDFDWPWGPHTPVMIARDEVMVFDNGYNRNFINNTQSSSENYSRAVIYKIDDKNNTVKQVWQYGKERGEETFSQALSGVQALPETGNILFAAGMGTHTSKGRGGHVIEVDRQSKEVVFEMEITAPSLTAFHRVNRLNVYPNGL